MKTDEEIDFIGEQLKSLKEWNDDDLSEIFAKQHDSLISDGKPLRFGDAAILLGKATVQEVGRALAQQSLIHQEEENLGEVLQSATQMLSVSVALAAIIPAILAIQFPASPGGISNTLQRIPDFSFLWMTFDTIRFIADLAYIYGVVAFTTTLVSISSILRAQNEAWWRCFSPFQSLGLLFYTSLFMLFAHFCIVSVVQQLAH